MKSWTRYWIRRHDDGTVSHLVRVRNIEGVGLQGEFFREDGQWHADDWAMTYLYDPLRGDEISASEAEQVVRQLGHRWPDVGFDQERDRKGKGLDHDSGPDIA